MYVYTWRNASKPTSEIFGVCVTASANEFSCCSQIGVFCCLLYDHCDLHFCAHLGTRNSAYVSRDIIFFGLACPLGAWSNEWRDFLLTALCRCAGKHVMCMT